jgi:hypothetical protein
LVTNSATFNSNVDITGIETLSNIQSRNITNAVSVTSSNITCSNIGVNVINPSEIFQLKGNIRLDPLTYGGCSTFIINEYNTSPSNKYWLLTTINVGTGSGVNGSLINLNGEFNRVDSSIKLKYMLNGYII